MPPRIHSLIGATSILLGVGLLVVLANKSGVTSDFESNTRIGSWLIISLSLLGQTWRAEPLTKPRFIWISLVGFIPVCLWLALPSRITRPGLNLPDGVSQEGIRSLVIAYQSAMESYYRHRCIGFSLLLIGLGFHNLLASVHGRPNNSMHSDVAATRRRR